MNNYDEEDFVTTFANKNKNFFKELFGKWTKISFSGDDDYTQSVRLYNPEIPETSPFYEYTRWNDKLDRIEFNGSCSWNHKIKGFTIYSQINRGPWNKEFSISQDYTDICHLAEKLYGDKYIRPLGFFLDSNLKQIRY